MVAKNAVRVVVVDDAFLVREAVTSVLEDEDGVEVVGAREDAVGLVPYVAARAADVVVTDVRMPPTHRDEGIAAANELRREAPGVGVVVLSQHLIPEYAVRLFEDGSAGRAYLLKDRVSRRGELVDAVRAVAEGRSVIDPEVVDALVSRRSGTRSPLDRLTQRETEVLAEMATGASNAAIAETLTLTERAVSKHINAILAKLDLPPEDSSVDRRVQAVLLFLSATTV